MREKVNHSISSLMEKAKYNNLLIVALNAIKLGCICTLFFLLSGCQKNSLIFKDKLPEILGVKEVIVENSSIIADGYSINGEGYTIETYAISKSSLYFFKEFQLTNNPIDNEGKWLAYGWKRCPVDSASHEVYSLIVNYKPSNDEVKSTISLIINAESSNENFYAYFYKQNFENPYHVYFFLIDMKNGNLYVVENHV